MRRLAGRVAIVTGGGSGIGAASAARLVAEGAKVVIGDVDKERASAVADELGDAASAFTFDAGNPQTVSALIDAAIERHGRLDILHNNAAIMTAEVMDRDTDAVSIPFDVWDETFRVNLRGYVAGCKYAIPHMIAQGGGAIVNTASDVGIYGDLTHIAYGSSKGGVIALTKYIATQHGAAGVRCNAIAPGLIITPGVRAVAEHLIEVMPRHTLTRRLGEPGDVAAAVAFLASDDAGYITGQVLTVDGGVSAHHPHTVELAVAGSEFAL